MYTDTICNRSEITNHFQCYSGACSSNKMKMQYMVELKINGIPLGKKATYK